MENAVEALKMAFAVMMFVMALTLSISSFSQARSAASSIINMSDRETEYTYVEPSENLTRTVGIETVVSTMYRAFEENLEIFFIDEDEKPIIIYEKKDTNSNFTEVSSINLENEGFASAKDAQEHLDIILGGITERDNKSENVKNRYDYTKENSRYKLKYNEGLYNKFNNSEFEELLGEYYQLEGAAKTKKRVITYKLK